MLLNICTLTLIFPDSELPKFFCKIHCNMRSFFPFWNKNVYTTRGLLEDIYNYIFYHVLDHYSVLKSFCHFWFRRIGHENFPLNDFGLLNLLSLRRHMECFFFFSLRRKQKLIILAAKPQISPEIWTNVNSILLSYCLIVDLKNHENLAIFFSVMNSELQIYRRLFDILISIKICLAKRRCRDPLLANGNVYELLRIPSREFRIVRSTGASFF